MAVLPFPAVVTAPDGRHWPMARLRFVGDTLDVFVYERGAVRLADTVEVLDVENPVAERGRPPRMKFATIDGEWVVEKGAGCGCGHPLKRANLDAVARAAAR